MPTAILRRDSATPPTMQRAALLACVVAVTAGCDPDGTSEAESAHVLMWLTSYKDAYVKCTSSVDCADENVNQASGSLQVAAEPIELKYTYVQYLLPKLPPGTTVSRAYMELYHPGEREDGQPDEQCLQVASVPQAWGPSTITYADQPTAPPNISREFQIAIRSQAWSVSSDIGPIVERLFADPNAHLGFVVYPAPNATLDKSFSDNTSRDADDLGKAPRLLVEATIPGGYDARDYGMPDHVPDDHDLEFPADADGAARMVQLSEDDDWPTEWDAGASKNDFTCAP